MIAIAPPVALQVVTLNLGETLNVDFSKQCLLHCKGLGIVHMNMCSIMDYFKVWVQQADRDILVFSDTKVLNIVKNADFCLDN